MANSVKKLRFETLEEYISYHQELATVHWTYLGKKTRGRVPNYQKEDRDLGVALCAKSFSARIIFARLALEELVTFAPLDTRENVHFVTIASNRHAIPMSEASAFNLRGLKIMVSRALSGIDYFGFVEGSYYPRWMQGVPHVSFHSHALTFNASERELQERKALLNQRHSSIIPGWGAFHSVPIRAAEVEPKLLYMLKMPSRAYKPYPLKLGPVDPTTDVIEKINTGQFDQKKDELRRGEFEKMADIFSEKYLDQLVIAGGQGILMKRRVLDRALAPFERSEYQRRRRFGR